jgi:hypothetical protein
MDIVRLLLRASSYCLYIYSMIRIELFTPSIEAENKIVQTVVLSRLLNHTSIIITSRFKTPTPQPELCDEPKSHKPPF